VGCGLPVVGSRADFGLDKLDYVMFVPKALQKISGAYSLNKIKKHTFLNEKTTTKYCCGFYFLIFG
jgi:hypothetical protein